MERIPSVEALFPRTPWQHQYEGVHKTIQFLERFAEPICLTSPTGTGKSLMQIALTRYGVQRDWPVILFTNRRLLLEQTMGVLDGANIRYGVRAATFPELRRDHEMVQLSSIQTEITRCINGDRMTLFPAKLVLVDEAHLMKAAGAEEIIQRYIDMGSKVVGVTATPLNLSHIYKHLVQA
jgi:superfamily II DNA or RNA helicase